MLKKHHQFFASLLWLLDMTMVLLAFGLAYNLRFFWQQVAPPRWGISPVEETTILLSSIVLIWTAVFRLSGLYAPRRTGRLLDETFLVLRASALSMLCLIALFYFFRDLRYSRLTIGFFGLFSSSGLMLTRALARKGLHRLRRQGYNLRHAVVLGTGDLARQLIERIDSHPDLGIQIRGVISDGAEQSANVAGHPVIGRIEQIGAVVRDHGIDQVYVALPLDQQQDLVQTLHALDDELVDIRVVPDLVQYYTLRGGVEELFGLPIVHLRNSPGVGWDAVTKRLFDLVFASLILLLLTPVVTLVAFLVKVTSPGPVFYRQQRMGLDGRTFPMLKFRSMQVDAETTTGAVWAARNDDRTTALGSWLRRLSLDELPQLLNVLVGDMSLVGPRPERPVLIEQFKKQIPRYHLRHKVKAGITGLAQIEGWRGQTSLTKRIERDLYYIENWSIWLDLKILLRTVLGGFLSRNAY